MRRSFRALENYLDSPLEFFESFDPCDADLTFRGRTYRIAGMTELLQDVLVHLRTREGAYQFFTLSTLGKEGFSTKPSKEWKKQVGLVICPLCGNNNPEDTPCMNCNIKPDSWFCPECSNANDDEFDICPVCDR